MGALDGFFFSRNKVNQPEQCRSAGHPNEVQCERSDFIGIRKCFDGREIYREKNIGCNQRKMCLGGGFHENDFTAKIVRTIDMRPLLRSLMPCNAIKKAALEDGFIY